MDRKQAMTKSAKSRNGQTKTVASNAPSSSKKKSDKKGKGDSTSNDRSLNNISNGKVKHRTTASVQSGGENEVSHPFISITLASSISNPSEHQLRQVVYIFILFLMQAQGGLHKIPKIGNERNGVLSLSPELMQLKKMRDEERQEREGIVVWKKPLTTLHYFSIELCLNIQEYAQK